MNKSKKDVLFFCQFFYPEYISSATLPFDTAKALRDSGLTVGVLCGYPKEYGNGEPVPLREKIDDISIHRLRYLQLKRSNFIGRLINYLSFTCSSLFHLAELKNYKCVIVYSNPPILPLLAVWAKKLFRTKLVFVSYDIYPEIAIRTGVSSKTGILARLMNYVNKRVYPSVDCVVALGTEMKNFILKNRSISESKVVVIPNWYEDTGELSKFPKEQNKFYQKYNGKLVVSYFGNMGTCQDIETILWAIRKLKEVPEIQFMFAGHGNKMDILKASVTDENLSNVDIYEFLKGRDFQDALAISDCAIVSLQKGITGLCVPSKTYGNMMSGSPIIAIMDDSDIVRDIQENQMGIVIKNGECEKLADELRALAANPMKCRVMGENSRKVFLRKYTTKICTDKYVDVIKKLLE